MDHDAPTEIQSGVKPPHSKVPWPHAPTHRLAEGGTFMVTTGTYQKKYLFSGDERLRGLHDGLLKYAAEHHWHLEAWAVFPNHYHFIAHSPEGDETGAASLSRFLNHFHSRSSAWLNKLDQTAGRKVWHNFWETHLTYERSYFARLNYVHQNAVHHGMVPVATQYPWCSAAWFEGTASPAQVRTIYGFQTDHLKILDDY